MCVFSPFIFYVQLKYTFGGRVFCWAVSLLVQAALRPKHRLLTIARHFEEYNAYSAH